MVRSTFDQMSLKVSLRKKREILPARGNDISLVTISNRLEPPFLRQIINLSKERRKDEAKRVDFERIKKNSSELSLGRTDLQRKIWASRRSTFCKPLIVKQKKMSFPTPKRPSSFDQPGYNYNMEAKRNNQPDFLPLFGQSKRGIGSFKEQSVRRKKNQACSDNLTTEILNIMALYGFSLYKKLLCIKSGFFILVPVTTPHTLKGDQGCPFFLRVFDRPLNTVLTENRKKSCPKWSA